MAALLPAQYSELLLIRDIFLATTDKNKISSNTKGKLPLSFMGFAV